MARSGRLASAASRAVRIIRVVKLLRPLFHLEMFSGKSSAAAGERQTASMQMAERLEEFVTTHSIICIFAMLTLSMTLAFNYGCDQSTSMDVAFTAFMQPLAICLKATIATDVTAGDQGSAPGLQEAACLREFAATLMPRMLRQYEAAALPLVYLHVSNTTLHGAADAYQSLFRRYPRSYRLSTYRLMFGAEEGESLEEGGGGGGGGGRGGGGGGGVDVVVHMGTKSQVLIQSKENLWTVASVLAVFVLLSAAFSSSMKHHLISASSAFSLLSVCLSLSLSLSLSLPLPLSLLLPLSLPLPQSWSCFWSLSL